MYGLISRYASKSCRCRSRFWSLSCLSTSSGPLAWPLRRAAQRIPESESSRWACWVSSFEIPRMKYWSSIRVPPPFRQLTKPSCSYSSGMGSLPRRSHGESEERQLSCANHFQIWGTGTNFVNGDGSSLRWDRCGSVRICCGWCSWMWTACWWSRCAGWTGPCGCRPGPARTARSRARTAGRPRGGPQPLPAPDREHRRGWAAGGHRVVGAAAVLRRGGLPSTHLLRAGRRRNHPLRATHPGAAEGAPDHRIGPGPPGQGQAR